MKQISTPETKAVIREMNMKEILEACSRLWHLWLRSDVTTFGKKYKHFKAILLKVVIN